MAIETTLDEILSTVKRTAEEIVLLRQRIESTELKLKDPCDHCYYRITMMEKPTPKTVEGESTTVPPMSKPWPGYKDMTTTEKQKWRFAPLQAKARAKFLGYTPTESSVDDEIPKPRKIPGVGGPLDTPSVRGERARDTVVAPSPETGNKFQEEQRFIVPVVDSSEHKLSVEERNKRLRTFLNGEEWLRGDEK